MPEQAMLRVHGQGNVEVELVTAYLVDLRHAYDSLLVFEATIDGLNRTARDFPFPLSFRALSAGLVLPRRGGLYLRDWPPTQEQVASAVPRSEQLVLHAVSLQSPGFWDFLGTLNPLEVTRKYLNDRHRRRQDKTYRESAEARKLELENVILENQALRERIEIAKSIGASDRDLAPLISSLVHKPLTALNRHQDAGTVDRAELVQRRDDKSPDDDKTTRRGS